MVASPDEFKQMCGKNIRRIREAEGLTQEELAFRMNITTAQVSRHERGEYVTIDALYDYADALGVRVDEIMKPEGDPLSEAVYKIRMLPEGIQKHIVTGLECQLAMCRDFAHSA